MEPTPQFQELLDPFVRGMLVFLPVLFGAVEFIKQKTGLKGRQVELLSAAIFVLFGALVVLATYFPLVGTQVAAVVVFLTMCVLAPSGNYKFINTRLPDPRGPQQDERMER